MTRAIRLQGLAFCMLAAAVMRWSVEHDVDQSRESLLFIAIAISLFGVPHGALDPLLASREFSLTSAWRWAAFGAVYAALAASVIAVWWWQPTAFLTIFLIISALHFSGDPAPGTARITRTLFGACILVLPAWRHEATVALLFAQLTNPSTAALITPALHVLAFPVFVVTLICAAAELRGSALTALEVTMAVILMAVAPPLIAFTTYFCTMHGARHLLRTVQADLAHSSPRQLASLIAPVAVVSGGAVWLVTMGEATSVDARVIRLLFVGLAALTVPHMLLIEPRRFRRPTDVRAPMQIGA